MTPDGEPRAVTAEDAYVIVVRFRGGGLGQVSLTATARHKRGDVVEVFGAEGTVASMPTSACTGAEPARNCRPRARSRADSKAAYGRVARNLFAAIRDGAPAEPGLQEALRVQALLDAVHRADVERRWVAPERI